MGNEITGCYFDEAIREAIEVSERAHRRMAEAAEAAESDGRLVFERARIE